MWVMGVTRVTSRVSGLIIASFLLTACGGSSDLTLLETQKKLEDASIPCEEPEFNNRVDDSKIEAFRLEAPGLPSKTGLVVPDHEHLTCLDRPDGDFDTRYEIVIFADSATKDEYLINQCAARTFPITGYFDLRSAQDAAIGTNWVGYSEEDSIVRPKDLADALGGSWEQVDDLCGDYSEDIAGLEEFQEAVTKWDEVAAQLLAEQEAEEEALQKAEEEARQKAEEARQKEAERVAAREGCQKQPVAGCQVKNQDFSGADFSGQNLQNVRFEDTNLANADFSGAKLDGAKFWSSDINGASFVDASLIDSTFYVYEYRSEKRNRVADFSDANLSGSRVTMEGLIGSTFEGANMSGSVLEGKVPWKVDFTDADLSGASISTKTTDLAGRSSEEVLDKPAYTYATWSNTTCPSGDVVDDPLDCPVDPRGKLKK